MKVVALVSGGKDSCYATQRCIDYGHEIIALANLLPMDDAVDELDSYMFQTVGHQMVGAIAQCMGLPLFRRRIQGTARLQQLRYKRTTGDEVEDLEKLLLAVKEKFPDVGGVSSGAIASDYQRLRVECICSRLGLVSFAYLWKQDQALLLQDMIDSGIHAILVKVAAIGMDPYNHLGKDLLSLQPHLTHLSSLYGSNVCGEGGEYESLTLDSPHFKHVRIVLDEYEVALHSPDQIAPVGVLHPTKFHLEVKSSGTKANLESFLTPVFEVTDDAFTEEEAVMDDVKSPVKELPDGLLSEVQSLVISQQHGLFTLGCWRQPNGKKLDVQEELQILLLKIEFLLQSMGLTWGNVVYVRLFLEDMVDFGAANVVYMNHITEEKCERGVPSRCCMQVCLTKGNMGQALLEVAVAVDLTKQVLHVQSISCWAPSCIGPYSQATLQGDILHMAGQLGLDPPTMTLIKGGAVVEMQQALNNCEEVAGVFKASLKNDALSITVYCSASLNPEDQMQVEECLWKFLAKRDRTDDGEGDTEALCTSTSTSTAGVPEPLIFYVLVPALPKGAKVEVEPLLFVDSDCDGDQSSSPSWYCVHFDPPPTTEVLDVGKMSNNLTCCSCEGLILHRRCCRALVCIGTSSGSIDVGGGDGGAQVGQGLEHALREAVTMLSVVLEQTSLCWLEVTAFRIYFDVEAITIDTLRAAVTKVSETAPTGFSTPMLIPVNGAGQTLKSPKLIVIDFMAQGAHSLS